MSTSTGTVTIEDGSVLHYETRGAPTSARPSLVLLHYYGGSPSTWAPLLSNPSFADFHIVRYHARGWAPSTGPPEAHAYGIATMSADLAAILAATGVHDAPGGFVLVGHSMGAKVVQHYAATMAPPGLKGLVLVAPAPLHALEFPEEAKKQSLAAYQKEKSVRFVLVNVLTAGPGALTEDVTTQCVADSMRGNEWATRAWPEYGPGDDYGELEGKIGVPALVLRGDKDFERDTVGPLGVEKGWVNRTVEDCGHLIPLEQPGRLGKEMLAFIGEVA